MSKSNNDEDDTSLILQKICNCILNAKGGASQGEYPITKEVEDLNNTLFKIKDRCDLVNKLEYFLSINIKEKFPKELSDDQENKKLNNEPLKKESSKIPNSSKAPQSLVSEEQKSVYTFPDNKGTINLNSNVKYFNVGSQELEKCKNSIQDDKTDKKKLNNENDNVEYSTLSVPSDQQQGVGDFSNVENQRNQLEKENSELKKINEKLEAENHKLNEELQDKNLKLMEKERKLQNEKTHIKTLNDELQVAEEKVKKLQAENHKLNEELQDKNLKLKEKETTDAESDNLKKKIDNLEKELYNEKTLKIPNDELQVAKEKIKKLQAENDKLNTTMKEHYSKSKEFQRKWKDSENSFNEYKDKYKNVIEDYEASKTEEKSKNEMTEIPRNQDNGDQL